jgi:hypothetical protein
MRYFLFIVFLLFSVLSFYSFSFAQTCQPDHTGFSEVPDSGVTIPYSIPHLVVGEKFTQIFTLGIASHKYWDALGMDVKINWVKFNRLENAPLGFKVFSSNGDSIFPQMNKLTWNCFTMMWTPLKAGKYSVDIIVDVSANTLFGNVIKKNVNYKQVDIFVDEPAVINNFNIARNNFLSCMPNPFSGNAQIEFFSPYYDSAEIKIFSSLGQLILLRNHNVVPGNNLFPLDARLLPDGFYYLSVSLCQKKLFARIVKY